MGLEEDALLRPSEDAGRLIPAFGSGYNETGRPKAPRLCFCNRSERRHDGAFVLL